VPTLYPPLVTGKADASGFDIEFAQAVAGRLEVRLVINTNPAMGRDFKPRKKHMLLDLWKKFVLLSGTSGMTSSTRQPLGVIRDDDDMRVRRTAPRCFGSPV
jgi:hypothetical protein